MSEADHVFPRQERQGAQTSSSEKRLILSAPRKGSKSRVVEVVHVQQGRSRPTDGLSRSAWSVRAETWPEGFRAKSASPPALHGSQPVAPEPAQPTVHVMPMWEPSPQQPVAEPAEPLVETAAFEGRKPHTPKPTAPKVNVRRFADPFAGGDSGANCIRCGYLVEQVREERGLMTCSNCG